MNAVTYLSSLDYIGRGDLPLMAIENEHGRAIISLQGGQLLSYIRKRDEREFFWLSDSANFETGKVIRGGVPICLPWFGPKPGKAQHGFGRTQMWRCCDDKPTFEFVARSDNLQHDFDHDFSARLEMTFTDRVLFNLSVTNDSQQPMPLSWALHSYHPVSNIQQTKVSGLEEYEYRDNTDGQQRKRQTGDLVFVGETDRAYLNVGATQVIEGAFEVSSTQARSAVVWNPGEELAQAMADLSDCSHFVCLERGDVLDNERMLLPGETFSAQVSVRAF